MRSAFTDSLLSTVISVLRRAGRRVRVLDWAEHQSTPRPRLSAQTPTDRSAPCPGEVETSAMFFSGVNENADG